MDMSVSRRVSVCVSMSMNVSVRINCNSTSDRLPEYFSLTISGTLLLKKNEHLSVSVFSSGDNEYRVHSESGFSCHELNELHGFHVTKVGQLDVAVGWTRVTGWRAIGEGGLYSIGGGFNADTGTFTASKKGAFYCAVQIHFARLSYEERRDVIFATYLHLRLDNDKHNALYSVITNGKFRQYYSLDISGLVALKVGQVLSVWVSSSVTTQVNSESGFSCHLMGTYKGFHAILRKDLRYGQGWSTLRKWSTWGSGGKYGWGGRPAADGSYMALESGYYACAAQVKGACVVVMSCM